MQRSGNPTYIWKEVLKGVPHGYFVFSIPKILRRYFIHDRRLLSDLSQPPWCDETEDALGRSELITLLDELESLKG